jgi:hypothetical protein
MLQQAMLSKPWIWKVLTWSKSSGMIFLLHFMTTGWYCIIYHNVCTGKSRYGICVNFYRPMERVPPGGGLGGSRRDRHSSTFRRESWRKSMEKSSDSAFSRLVTHSFPKISLWSVQNHNCCKILFRGESVKKK